MIERTLVLIKPDGVQRQLVGRIIQRFEDVGLKIVGMKMMGVDKDFGEKHYFDVKQRYDERIFNNLVGYLSQGPVIAMVIEGVHAIQIVRKMAGSTYPSEAPPGTIRGDFSHISKEYANATDKTVSNLIHASAKPEEAKYEITLWFKPEEIYNYKTVHEVHTL